MQQANYKFAHHVEQIAKLLYLGQTSKIQKYTAGLDQSMQDSLEPWLYSLQLSEGGSLTSKEQVTLSDHEASSCGWGAYYRNEYLLAHDYFKQSILQEGWQEYSLNSALGLAKVYTRTGHWASARDWCLYYLTLARQHSNHFEVAKGYGALAEVFLRASCANEALACFQTAYHLMPLGQGQRAKQYNFMASALLRNKEMLRAEVLLHTSRQVSRNVLEKDPTNQDALASFCHSIMRFYYLNLLQSEGDALSVINQDDEALMAQVTESNQLAVVPLGLLQVAKGIGNLKKDLPQAKAHFEQAMKYFGPTLIMEYHWASRLKNSCTHEKTKQDTTELEKIFALQPMLAPVFDTVLDTTWQKVQLSNQGFLPLIKAHTSAELLELWTLFFI